MVYINVKRYVLLLVRYKGEGKEDYLYDDINKNSDNGK